MLYLFYDFRSGCMNREGYCGFYRAMIDIMGVLCEAHIYSYRASDQYKPVNFTTHINENGIISA